MKLLVVAICILAAISISLPAAEPAASNGSGTFVSFNEGTLTIRGKSGLLVYERVGANFKTYQNNESGPGSKLVETVDALSHVAPGMLVLVNPQDREISFGLDYRVTGSFVSFDDGKLNLVAADVPAGFIKKPAGSVALTVSAATPVLESVDGGDYKFAGPAAEVLKTVKKGANVTARSEFDPETIEVIQIGNPKRQIERYVGQTRATVRGAFMSFKGSVLRIRGKGVMRTAASEYERVINFKIATTVPIVESIDGGDYKPATAKTLETLKEGTTITIRKVEEVVLEVQIGVPSKK